MVMKYIKLKGKVFENSISKNFLRNDISQIFKYDIHEKNWIKYYNSIFLPIPIEIFQEIEWRGTKMKIRFDNIDKIFSHNYEPGKKYSFNDFLIEYRRFINYSKTYFFNKYTL